MIGGGRVKRPIATQRNPAQQAVMWVVVTARIVLNGSVIPE